jgi:hypothetical protein
MLIPEHDLERQHFFAVCLKPKVSGLDDPGVDGAYRYFVDLIAFESRERIGAALKRYRRGPA